MKNPFYKNTGSAVFFKIPVILILILGVIITSIIISKGGLIITLVLIVLPGILFFLNRLFNNPKFGMYAVIFAGFTANGLNRYFVDLSFGLSIDTILVLTYIAIFFKEFNRKMNWSPAASDLTFVASIWFAYSLLELLNPESLSKMAWFFAMRGVSLYMFLMIPLVLMLMNKYRDLNFFLYLWAIFSILATIRGIVQLNFGLDPWEKHWLDLGNYKTHVLFGKLRIFSFYSDAGQFGAAQAHAGLVGTIIFLHAKKTKEKILFGVMAIMGFYGMFISGTRGAMAVPFAGFFLYLILTRNLKMITIGTLLGITVFIFFKFTMIGQGVYAIRRMRTGFDPNEPSLLVRLENQKKLSVYLADKPLGGGIGSAGNWGQRFSPQGFLANVPTDSWYVMIWAEQGVIGLALHLMVLFYILGRGAYLSMFNVRDPVLQGKLFALASGILGIMAASYGNGVLGQLPTSLLLYSSMAFLFLGRRMNDENYDHKPTQIELQKS